MMGGGMGGSWFGSMGVQGGTCEPTEPHATSRGSWTAGRFLTTLASFGSPQGRFILGPLIRRCAAPLQGEKLNPLATGEGGRRPVGPGIG